MQPVADIKNTQKTTCPYCGVGCGVITSVDQQGAVTVKGDIEHPANLGKLCSKGTALGETVALNERLLYPEIMGEQVSWEQAISTAAGRFKEIIAEHGADSVAFYVSGQLLTEDYYIANKLMKGFIGSANIDTNSRLCMSSAVSAYKRAFGEDIVPCNYEDLEKAKLIVLTGSNTAWCHPVIYQRIARAKQINPDLQIITIDPRMIQTTRLADLHLSIKPGSDSILFNGLLVWLEKNGEANILYLENFTSGYEQTLKTAISSAATLDVVAEQCELSIADVEKFYRLFARTERTVTVFSQGINQSSSGTDKGNAIINCHLFTGRIGRPGMGPFSLTGQPNAMGGREVGGLANQLAAHMEITSQLHREIVQNFWQSPYIPHEEGLKAVELFDAIADGKIKAIWIMATNPVVSMPNADKVKRALKNCPLVIVSDCVQQTDTSKLAHINFPATTWGERDGTVTNSERRISRQRPFLQAPGLAQPDWWIINEFAKQMGFEKHFGYHSPAEIFREHAQLSGYKNNNDRLFDISALAEISNKQYDEIFPLQWPVTEQCLQGSTSVLNDGQFYTRDKKAHLIPVIPKPPGKQTNEFYSFVLNTGRVRDHWHTMTRTGMSPRLSSHTIESYVEIHPDDAENSGVNEGELVKIASPNPDFNDNNSENVHQDKEILVRVRLSDKQRIGSLFVPMHWNDQFCSQARVGTLVDAVVDPVSGQPESKHGIAKIKNCQANWYAFMITRHKPELQFSHYWSRSRGKGFWRYELAGLEAPQDWSEHAHKLLGHRVENENWLEFYDKNRNHYRAVRMSGKRLDSCLFIYPDINLPPRDWLISLFHKEEITQQERSNLLKGEAPGDQEDTGKIICACFNIGEKTINEAIKKQGLNSIEAIGEQLKAGTNCGSCKPELAELLGAD
ncbi:MAG: molybdopterin-dependent oxidoreductase [gamma proteobacterium symbiont of Bathyaustriella thionipta]|nr:molybdopterin-dependent oxidoreductase [gamma proteobacterium symbiont of Bathyaustriella thionipta]MCU7950891.1 molybdopterin-dependent oxidoreductase [gamma proteobacterium symbiont of Bathyaustriella thionipta]MCU7952830.1 molybdopterin-dependent oxidoreductase [gamma proteobacterium symbiont of Bathyaustriella thionipta]MCU7957385.1 molybdopterin-dependent oxidoreductase [gamma proteobacterium symbiont of Bathyaustriella thionipta]MCU7967184.1 molybdopterin-dependent oxidoreductase [gamm